MVNNMSYHPRSYLRQKYYSSVCKNNQNLEKVITKWLSTMSTILSTPMIVFLYKKTSQYRLWKHTDQEFLRTLLRRLRQGDFFPRYSIMDASDVYQITGSFLDFIIYLETYRIIKLLLFPIYVYYFYFHHLISKQRGKLKAKMGSGQCSEREHKVTEHLTKI